MLKNLKLAEDFVYYKPVVWPNGVNICNHGPLSIENKIILNTMHALAMGLQSLKMFNFSLGQSPVINVQMHNALARSVAAFTIFS